MITREQLFDFTDKYQENMDKQQELNDSLLLPCSREEWFLLLKERSDTIREAFERNEKWLPVIYEEMRHLTLEKAEFFYEALLDILTNGFKNSDFQLMIGFAEGLLPFYEEIGNCDRIVRICHILFCCNIDYYDRLLGKNDPEESLAYAKKVLSYSKHYADFNDKGTRLCFYKTYYNILELLQFHEMPFPEAVNWYKRLEAFWESDTVQRIDGTDAMFLSAMERIKSSFLNHCYIYMAENGKDTAADEYGFCKEFMENVINSVPEEELEEDMSLLRCKYLLDIINENSSPDELVRQTIEKMEALPEINFDEDMDAANEILETLIATERFFWDILDMTSFDGTEKHRVVKIVTELFLRQVKNIPGNVQTNYLNDVYARFFYYSFPYLNSLSEKETVLEKMILSRQPLTFVHSYMVEQLAVMLAKSFFPNSRNCFPVFRGLKRQSCC